MNLALPFLIASLPTFWIKITVHVRLDRTFSIKMSDRVLTTTDNLMSRLLATTKQNT